MAAKKATKRPMSSRRAAAKKSSAKRPGGKNVMKRTRRASTVTKGAAKSPRRENRATASARGSQGELERKPAKKVEVRPARPPAVLPIPQSTFFF